MYILTGRGFVHGFPAGEKQNSKYLQINLEFSKGV